mmetsp:Transcript_19822/g.74951  ORF Transcript_19822/g.74951 Transcript_19822/m.74951 type:complete len:235 (+) Transcript_19822:6505-7209(+)
MLPILRSFKHPRRRVPDLAVIRRHKLVAVDPTGGGEPEDEHAEARVEPFRLIRFDKVRALLIIGRSCRRRAYLRHLDLPSVGIEEPELLHLHAVAALPHAEGHESIVEVRRFGIVWRRTAMVRPDGGEFPAPVRVARVGLPVIVELGASQSQRRKACDAGKVLGRSSAAAAEDLRTVSAGLEIVQVLRQSLVGVESEEVHGLFGRGLLVEGHGQVRCPGHRHLLVDILIVVVRV